MRQPTFPSTLLGRVVRSARAVLAIAAFMTAPALQSAGAQQAARLRLAVDAAPRAVPAPRPFSFQPTPAPMDSVEHGSSVKHYATVGALVGVAAGLVYTIALNTTKSCTERNNVVCREDEHDNRTFTYPLYGLVLGGVFGALVGTTRH